MTTENSDIMVEADAVSMRFDLGIERGFSLKQWFVELGHGAHRKKESF